MAETITSNQEVKASGADKRRSTRVAMSIAIVVAGVDTLGEPFREATTTTEVNCYGCRYRSKNYVQKGADVALEIPHPELRLPPRLARGRVIWVQRPRRMREPYHVALEFETPGNIWGITSPPKDWFPHPDEAKGAIAGAADAVLRGEQPTSGAAGMQEEPTFPSSEVVASEREARVVAVDEMTFTLGNLEGPAAPSETQTLSGVVERVVDKTLQEIREQMMERLLATITEAREASQLTAEEVERRLRKALEAVMDSPSAQPLEGKSTKQRRRSKTKVSG